MCDKVLDVEKGSTDPGTHVVLYEFNGNDNQMFYEDRSGVIRAKINKFALDGSGKEIHMCICTYTYVMCLKFDFVCVSKS